jgi:hypothetical protein
MTVMRKLAAGALVAVGVSGLAAIGTAQASPVPAAGVWAEGWASPGCVPVLIVSRRTACVSARVLGTRVQVGLWAEACYFRGSVEGINVDHQDSDHRRSE